MGELGDTVLRFIGGATAAVLLLTAIARLVSFLVKGNGKRTDLDTLREVTKIVRDENDQLRKREVEYLVEIANLRRKLNNAQEHLFVFALERRESPPSVDEPPEIPPPDREAS